MKRLGLRHSFPMVLTRGWGAKRVHDRLVRDRLLVDGHDTSTSRIRDRSARNDGLGDVTTSRAVVLLGVAWDRDDRLGCVGMNRFGSFLGVAWRGARVARVSRLGSGIGTKEGRDREGTIARDGKGCSGEYWWRPLDARKPMG